MPFNSLSPSLHPLGHLWRLWRLWLVTYVTYTCPYVVAQDDNGTAVSTVAPNLLLEEPLCGYSKRDLAFKVVESYTANALLLSTNQYEDNFYDDKSTRHYLFKPKSYILFPVLFLKQLLSYLNFDPLFFVSTPNPLFLRCVFLKPRFAGTDSVHSSHLTLISL